MRDLYAEQRNYATFNGRQVLAFGIQRAKNESDISVYRRRAPSGCGSSRSAIPTSASSRSSTRSNMPRPNIIRRWKSLIEGAVLAVLVVFLFLRDWRATLISAIAIPLSAIPTFWFMELLGFTLNSMTLMALGLVAGVLVDDAIVEIENIVRHMRMGKSAYQASIDAADEIGLAVVGTTFSIVAVFLPVGLMPDVAGEYFRNFGFTVVAAVLISLGVARLITPMLAAYFLKAKGHATHGEGWLMDRYMSAARLHAAASLDDRGRRRRLAGADRRLLHDRCRRPSSPTPTRTSPASRSRWCPGTTLAQTGAAARQVEAVLRQQPEVESVFSRVRVGNATVSATLKERDERERTSQELERAVAPLLNRIPDARAFFRSQQTGGRALNLIARRRRSGPAQPGRAADRRGNGDDPRAGRAARQRRPAAARDRDPAAARPRRRSRRHHGGAEQRDPHRHPGRDRPEQRPLLAVRPPDPDPGGAERECARSGSPISRICRCRPSTGGSVPLKLVADIGFGAGPTLIQRTNQVRRITIGADLAPGVVSGEAWTKIRQLPTMRNLPPGVRELLIGQNRWQAEMMSNFMIAVVAGILLVLAVLMLLYHRFMPPLVNLGSLLLAPLGGLIALMHHRPADLADGLYRPADAARHRRQELDPADRLRARGDGQGRAEDGGDPRRRPQARPADRHDDGGDERRHDPDRDRAVAATPPGARRWASS